MSQNTSENARDCVVSAVMNKILRPRDFLLTTQAAEGMARRRWSVAEIEAMVAAGILLEDERFELIGGEVVPMSPKGNRHEVVKQALQEYWFPKVAGGDVGLITETTLRTGADSYCEPDFLFWPRSIALADITVATTLLLVEVADTSLAYDTGRKAHSYGALGLREYWVINALTLTTHIHRKPSADGYGWTRKLGPTKRLVPKLLPALAVALAGLGLEPLADD